MSYLTADEILKADDLATEDVDVPEWGGKVRICTLRARDRDAYEASIIKVDVHNNVRQDYNNMRAKLLARTIVDEAGKRLFTDQQIEALGDKSAAAMDRCFSVASRLNAVSNSDLEELAKN